MDAPFSPGTRPGSLHQFAEERLAAHSPAGIEALSAEAASRLIHELQVHQFELEAQNQQLRQANLELEAARSRFIDLYDGAPVGYLTLSPSRLILQANQMASTMLGVARGALIKQPFSGFLGPENADTFYLLHKQLLATGAPQSCTLPRVNELGTVFWKLYVALAEDDEGLQGCRVVLSDISECRTEASHRELDRRYRRMVETAEEGIITVDGQARIDFVNPKMLRMFGCTVEEVIGRPLTDFMDEEWRGVLSYYLARRQQGISEQFDFKFLRKDGSDLWVHTSTNPLTDASGNYVGALAMVTDIGERRQAQQLLAWEKDALELIAGQTTLGPVLDSLMLGLENCFPGALCAVLLLDDDGLRLRHGAAPSLPEAYQRLLDGIAIGPAAGPCVTAVYAGRQIIVPDIATDPLWADHREPALTLGLRACWSTPIQGTEGKILGTLAIHYVQPRQPGSLELEAMERAMRIASVAIERKKAEERLAAYQNSLREANEKLLLINEELESRVVVRTSQLRALACQLSDAEERERLRVADLLHEGLLQLLATVAMGLDGLGQHLAEGAPPGCLQNLRGILLESIEMGRNLTYELFPPSLHGREFGLAVSWLGSWHHAKHGLSVQVKAPPRFCLQERELRTLLFRAANELLFNVHRHAQVGLAQLVLDLLPDGAVRLVVSDSGAGFDPAAARAREGVVGGFGLFSLRERVEALGGTLQVDGALGRGTRVTVTVPRTAGG